MKGYFRQVGPPAAEPNHQREPATDWLDLQPNGIRSRHSGPRRSLYPSLPWRKAATRCVASASEVSRRKPITGIAGCCARRERPRSRAPEQHDERAPLHVWMAPAWQEITSRAAQKSLAVMCPASPRPLADVTLPGA